MMTNLSRFFSRKPRPSGDTMTAMTATRSPEEKLLDAIELSQPLTLQDRCDVDGAAAYVRVHFAEGAPLLFCGHHARKFAASFAERATHVHDETERLELEHGPNAQRDAGSALA